MKLLEGIRNHWAASEAITALVPVERVAIGRAADAATPRVILSLSAAKPAVCCGDGTSLVHVAARIEILHDVYATAVQIAGLVRAAFDRASFNLPDGGKTLDVRVTDESHRAQEGARWLITIDLDCLVEA